MIPVSYTIVHKCAMVVKTLYALVAIVAMHRVFWSQNFTIDADVVEMEFFIDKPFNKP